MRALALLAAITMMRMVYAIPRRDLTVRQGGGDLNNQSHVFHHLDRNPLTANRDRERLHGNEERTPAAEKRVQERSRGAELDAVLERRFMQSPDYSQGGSNSASAVSDTMPTPRPAAKAEKESTKEG